MKLVVCSVFDEKAKAFMNPYFVPNVQIASRAFGDAVLSPDSALAKHASDYKLYQVGIFDDNVGIFDGKFIRPEYIACAADFIKQEEVKDEENK